MFAAIWEDVLMILLVDQRAAGVFRKDEFADLVRIIDYQQVAHPHLIGRDEVRQRIDQKALDGAFQVPGAVFEINPLFEQEIFRRLRAFEDELLARPLGDSSLNRPQFDLQNLGQVIAVQAAEDHDLIDPVHEFRREFTLRGFERRPVNLLIDFGVDHAALRGEADSARNQFAHLARAQVRRHDHDRAGEIDAAVVTQRQRGFVEDAEQQLPERVGGLFDLVEEHQAQFGHLGVRAIEVLLRQHRRSLTVSEVARRRTDQFRYLVRMLKLCAIDLCDQVGVAKEDLGGGLDYPRLARTRRPEEEQCSDRAARMSQARQKDLIQAGDASYSAILSDDQRGKFVLEFLSGRAFQVGVEVNRAWRRFLSGSHHRLLVSAFTLKLLTHLVVIINDPPVKIFASLNSVEKWAPLDVWSIIPVVQILPRHAETTTFLCCNLIASCR